VPDDRPVRPTLRIEIAPRTLFTILGIVAGVYLLGQLRLVVLLVVIALILVGTLVPFITRLERHRVPRGLAVAIVFAGLIGLVSTVFVLTLPPLVRQLGDLVEKAPALQARIADHMAHLRLLAPFADAVREARSAELFKWIAAHLFDVSQRLLTLVGAVVTTLFLALYLIADRERSLAALRAVVPRRHHGRIIPILGRLEEIVGGYVRGQVVTSVLMTLFVLILLTILQVPSALALGVFAGITDVIPFIGGVIAITPAALVALSRGPISAIVVVVGMLVYQELESRLVVPRVYGRALRLPPAAVIVALLAGGTLAGIAGALLALPIAAALRMFVQELRVSLPGQTQPQK
jgi:predicted PurR-regulated permease PerM